MTRMPKGARTIEHLHQLCPQGMVRGSNIHHLRVQFATEQCHQHSQKSELFIQAVQHWSEPTVPLQTSPDGRHKKMFPYGQYFPCTIPTFLWHSSSISRPRHLRRISQDSRLADRHILQISTFPTAALDQIETRRLSQNPSSLLLTCSTIFG